MLAFATTADIIEDVSGKTC